MLFNPMAILNCLGHEHHDVSRLVYATQKIIICNDSNDQFVRFSLLVEMFNGLTVMYIAVQ